MARILALWSLLSTVSLDPTLRGTEGAAWGEVWNISYSTLGKHWLLWELLYSWICYAWFVLLVLNICTSD